MESDSGSDAFPYRKLNSRVQKFYIDIPERPPLCRHNYNPHTQERLSFEN